MTLKVSCPLPVGLITIFSGDDGGGDGGGGGEEGGEEGGGEPVAVSSANTPDSMTVVERPSVVISA
jgi:hypothetical protein